MILERWGADMDESSNTEPGGPAAPEELAPLSRRTLHDDVVGRIRDLIIEGHLAPGSRIHEGQFGQALGVSRTPLREALKFLASEGLIDLVPGRGAVVRRLAPTDIRDMLEVLAALEALAGRLACQAASYQDIAGVRRLHTEMMAAYAAGDRLDYYKKNQAIHSAIARISGNAFLASLHQSIQARLKRIRFMGHGDPAKWRAAVEEHEEILGALESRNAEGLAEVLSQHIQRSWERVRDLL